MGGDEDGDALAIGEKKREVNRLTFSDGVDVGARERK